MSDPAGRFPVCSGGLLAAFGAATIARSADLGGCAPSQCRGGGERPRPGQDDLDPADAERLLAGITLEPIDH